MMQSHITLYCHLLAMAGLVAGIRIHKQPSAAASQELKAQYRSAVHKYIETYKPDKNEPIVVTAFDHYYNNFTNKWIARNNELGMRQMLLLPLDHEATVNVQPGTPVIADGIFVSSSQGMHLKEMSLAEKALRKNLPKNLAVLKFLVPGLLLEEGFQRVFFSELDVFFFKNPADATKTQEGHFFAMDALIKGCRCTNIGFMEFRADSENNLAQPLFDFTEQLMQLSEAELSKVSLDQSKFNNFWPKSSLKWEELDRKYFAVSGSRRSDETKVVHMAGASPACKVERLQQLYDNPKSSWKEQTGKKGFSNRHFSGMDC